jgi:hypothetical protein
MFDHVQQLFAVVVLLDHAQRADGRAQRGERVLDFMRDIGGELFVRLDPVIKRRHHAAQRARQAPDLVGAGGQVGDADAAGRHLARVAVAAQFGRGGQIGQRVGDGRGQHEAEPDRHQQRDDEHLQHLFAFVAHKLVNLARRRDVTATTPTTVPSRRIGVATENSVLHRCILAARTVVCPRAPRRPALRARLCGVEPDAGQTLSGTGTGRHAVPDGVQQSVMKVLRGGQPGIQPVAGARLPDGGGNHWPLRSKTKVRSPVPPRSAPASARPPPLRGRPAPGHGLRHPRLDRVGDQPRLGHQGRFALQHKAVAERVENSTPPPAPPAPAG